MRAVAGLPASVAGATREVHDVEPELFPDAELARSPRYFPSAPSAAGDALRRLLGAAPRRVTHVIAVPWLKRGGADLEALNYAWALDESGYGASTVVLLTDATLAESPWARRLPPDVRCIEFLQLTRALMPAEAEHVLATFLIQSRTNVVHVLSARVAVGAIRRFGDGLSNAGCALFASVFCEDVAPTGQTVGFAFEEIPSVAGRLFGIFADNRRILDRLVETYGIDPDRAFVHRHPHGVGVEAARPERREVAVLWAGRLDRQRRPDLLLEIARRTMGLPIRFHVYGEPLVDPQVRRRDLRAPNLTFHGPYDGFESLPAGDFDIFLNTSQWDGMPNVVLEAMACGLPVVSSAVGGIPEVVDNRSGALVERFDDAHEYVRELARLAGDRGLRERLGAAARARIEADYSRAQFVDALRAVPGYLSPRAGGAAPRSI